MEPSDTPCHLLELPREIRQQIYNDVIHLAQPIDLPWCVAWRSRGGHPRRKAPEGCFSLPWLSLTSTCKTIHGELEAYMDLKGPSHEKECRAWALELFADRLALRDPVRWHRIACPPSSVETLAVVITFFNQRTKFKDLRGPREITWHLYQALNQFLHYGPLLSRRSPLPVPVKLKTLVVQVAIDPTPVSVDPALDSRWYQRIPGSEFQNLCDLIEILDGTGLLWGYVDSVRIIDEEGQEEEIEISCVENAVVPKRWHGYGFEWGPLKEEPQDGMPSTST